MNLSSEQVESIVQRVVKNVLVEKGTDPIEEQNTPTGDWGVYSCVNEAINAAHQAFLEYDERCDVQCRTRFVDAVREMALDHKEEFARMTVDETKMGRIEHKILKHINAAKNTPGVECLQPQSWSGKNGFAVDEYGPYGVIGNITPSTHPVPVMINNIIIQLAAGNTIVFNPHPSAKKVNAYCIKLANQYMVNAGAPKNLVTCVEEPTVDSAKSIFEHPKVKFLSVTGGPFMVDLAMKYPKKIIAAGPGNPPALVDETANIELAAKEISDSSSYDNNVLCTAEKQIIVVDQVFEKFMKAFEKQGNIRLTTNQMNSLAEKALFQDGKHWLIHGDYVGRNANVLGKALGMNFGDDVPLLFGETDLRHPWVVSEQMTSCIPVVRVRDFDEGIKAALYSEHGFRHTASIFTSLMDRATVYTKKMKCNVLVINGGTWRGDGGDLGEAYFSHTIAGPTGEGITTALDFVRKQRVMVTGSMRFV